MVSENLAEDELIESILQQAWDKLLQARREGKLPGFDAQVPAQIQSWLCDIYSTQLDTLRLTDKDAWLAKRFSISIAYRISLRATVGIDYFMQTMNDTNKMQAMDRLINEIERGLKKDIDIRRSMR